MSIVTVAREHLTKDFEEIFRQHYLLVVFEIGLHRLFPLLPLSGFLHGR